MKLIVEKMDGVVYIYKEEEKHHKIVEPKRGNLSGYTLTKVDPEVLQHECDTSRNDSIPQDNWYMVFNLRGK